MDDLQAIDLAGISDQLLTLLRDPTSNVRAALILYGMIGLLIIIVLVLGIVLLMGVSDDEDEVAEEGGSGSTEGQVEGENGIPALVPAAKPVVVPPPPRTLRSLVVSLSVVLVLLAAVWVLAGFTTSSKSICGACHVSTVHDQAKEGEDPHGSSECVSCHEPGGVVGRYVSGVPSRILHFAQGGTGLPAQPAYGRVSSSACSACHAQGIARTTINPENGVRMSHAEPIAARARCLDCHEPTDGTVSRRTVGMGVCLRCHNAVTASAECSTCHDKQTAAAARARTTSFAKQQVEAIKCGGCHDEKVECDTCHGVRMPHSAGFMASSHARAGAVNFWFNGGQTCTKNGCHTETRRPCIKCHSELLGKGHPASMAVDHQSSVAAGCGCHEAKATPPGRDFCAVCHSEAAVKESPR